MLRTTKCSPARLHKQLLGIFHVEITIKLYGLSRYKILCSYNVTKITKIDLQWYGVLKCQIKCYDESFN
jgi:hypothetical protein